MTTAGPRRRRRSGVITAVVAAIVAVGGALRARREAPPAAFATTPSEAMSRRVLVLGSGAVLLLPGSLLALAQEAPASQMTVGIGVAAEELAFPAWLVGDWACAGELIGAEAGPGGESALKSVLGAADALQSARSAVGTEVSLGRSRLRWKSTTKSAPLSEGGGAAEEGTSGAAAAAAALAGPSTLAPLPDDGSAPAWRVRATAGREPWQLRAAGAVLRPDQTADGDRFRLSELFQVEKPGAAADGEGPGGPVVRIVTTYRRVPLQDSPTGGAFKIGLGEVDKSRPFLVQGIRVATLLAGAPQAGSEAGVELASYKTRLLLSPLLAK